MRNNVLFACMLIAGLVAMGESLMCNTCSLVMEEDCLGNSSETVTCGTNQSCFIQTLNFTGFNFRTKGCANNTQCGLVATIMNLNATLMVNTTCCTTDQCNGATSLHILLPAVISAALVAVWTSYKQ